MGETLHVTMSVPTASRKDGKGDIQMAEKRPESMERINTPELARKFIDEQIAALREQIGDKGVLLALSGGVDSSVVAALLIKAVGKQLTCVHVNHGLLRKGEPEQVVKVFRDEMDANLVYVDASERFLEKLKDANRLVRVGSTRTGYYQILENKEATRDS